jgi:hypothetical protein
LPCRAFLPVNGEKEAGGNVGVFLATLAIGEINGDSALSPSLYGERMPAGSEGQRKRPEQSE